MKAINSSLYLLSILGGLAFTISASAGSATIPLSCDPDTYWCSGTLGVSSGVGQTQWLFFGSQQANNFLITNLPNRVHPPAPGHANTVYTGKIQVYSLNNASGTIIYNVVEDIGGQNVTVGVCTYKLSSINNPGYLTVTGSCTGGFNAPVIPDPSPHAHPNTVDMGVN